MKAQPFATPQDWANWLSQNHATQTELWIRLFRKASGTLSITWEQAVIEALCWGWIDGQRKPFDETSWQQRFTPRRKGGTWSQKNVGHVERLIAEGRMQPAGLVQIDAAKASGRWDAAYSGGVGAEVPSDFLAALAAGPETARIAFSSLDRKNLYAIYHRLITAKRPETRAKRTNDLVALLARGEHIL
jgi:uncharacterized protein YdeI (YjbR/CyaY-like superfamily)